MRKQGRMCADNTRKKYYYYYYYYYYYDQYSHIQTLVLPVKDTSSILLSLINLSPTVLPLPQMREAMAGEWPVSTNTSWTICKKKKIN